MDRLVHCTRRMSGRIAGAVIAPFFMAGAVAACSSGGASGTGKTEGTVFGEPFTVADVLFAREGAEGGLLGGGHGTRVVAKLTSFAGACDVANEQDNVPDSAFLTLYLEKTTADGPELPAAGTYSSSREEGKTHFVGAYFTKWDHACEEEGVAAVTGTVTVDSIDWEEDEEGMLADGEMNASFTLQFGEETLSGSFKASVCSYGWYIGGGGECVARQE